MNTTNNWKYTGIIALCIIVIMIPLSLVFHKTSSENINSKAEFVGGDKCISCHLKEYNLWKGSDHDNAMDIATDSTVLGDFNKIEVSFRGKNHKFYKRDEKFYVYTEGPDGKMAEFQITHTFGVRPLQQYLIPFDKGKFQCLPIAWDTENEKWFDLAGMLYSTEELTPGSYFFWTNQAQNWNGVCAECHSTNLNKTYDIENDSFHTTWSDIDVNCEACHGPGSKHLEWASLPESSRDYDPNMGLILQTSGTTSRQYIEACAPCHSRRTALGVNDHTSNEYYNNYQPQLITPSLYFKDGQILDEDYVFGSFTQSKMYMHDVKCSDCHDSHSIKLKFEGNALCTQCHRSEEYDTYQHHFHKYKNETGQPVVDKFGKEIAVGEGALCINCHMPGRYYMGIDFRRDHSFRIPRPDLSIKHNTPNACNDCHADKSFQWSEKYLRKYYGERKKFSYASVLSDGYEQIPNADSELIKMIKNNLYPEIVRATALQYLSSYHSDDVSATIRQMLDDPEPVIRETAVRVFTSINQEDYIATLLPLLNDPSKIVRITAANQLSGLPKTDFTETQFKNLTSGINEYLKTLEYTTDFPSGKYNLGNYYSNQGDLLKAENFYKNAIEEDHLFYPAKSNLALLYYNEGKLADAEKMFMDLIKNHKEYTQGEYYLGLLYAEQKRYLEAVNIMVKATTRKEVNPRIYYNLGLIYQYINKPQKAESSLLKAYSISPTEYDVLYALIDFYTKSGNQKMAMKYTKELNEKFPSNPAGMRN